MNQRARSTCQDKVERLHLIVDAGAQQALEELIEPLGCPLAVHVGLAEADAVARQHPFGHAGLEQPDIPGPVALQPDVGLGQTDLPSIALAPAAENAADGPVS